MNSQAMIEKFWKKTEEALRKSQSQFRRIYLSIADEIVLIIKAYELTSEKLKKPLTYKDRKALLTRISDWKRDGIYKGYFRALVEMNKKRSYDDLLFVMMLYYCVLKGRNIVALAKQIARISADDVKEQAEEDSGLILPRPTDKSIEDGLYVTAYNMPFDSYVNLEMARNANRAMVTVRSAYTIEYKGELDDALEDRFEGFCDEMIKIAEKPKYTTTEIKKAIKAGTPKKEAEKMANERATKTSGWLVQSIRAMANRVYLWLFGSKDVIMMFIAEIDNRTTKMCRSLHLQTFRLNGINTFKRYSASNGGIAEYRRRGLVEGLNLPPITDHFHWCRSRVVYAGTNIRYIERE